MAVNANLAVRKALIRALKADGGMRAIIGAPGGVAPTQRVYANVSPDPVTWPFSLVGAMTTTPKRAQCLDGSDVSVTMHAFAKGPGDDACQALMSAMMAALPDTLSIDLTPDGVAGRLYRIRFDNWQSPFRDAADVTGFHGVMQLTAKVAS